MKTTDRDLVDRAFLILSYCAKENENLIQCTMHNAQLLCRLRRGSGATAKPPICPRSDELILSSKLRDKSPPQRYAKNFFISPKE